LAATIQELRGGRARRTGRDSRVTAQAMNASYQTQSSSDYR
jgi:hypothetical protein